MGGVVAGRASDAAAGMRPRTAQIQAIDGGAVLRPSGNRAHEEELLQAKVAMEDVAFS